MAKYRLIVKQSVLKDLRPIPKHDIARIMQAMAGLQDDPRPIGAEKLSGQDKYRLRQGVYRIVYEIVDELLIVTVVKVGHRQSVYRRSYR
jgi:mRNA interferase RelE/StbE